MGTLVTKLQISDAKTATSFKAHLKSSFICFASDKFAIPESSTSDLFVLKPIQY